MEAASGAAIFCSTSIEGFLDAAATLITPCTCFTSSWKASICAFRFSPPTFCVVAYQGAKNSATSSPYASPAAEDAAAAEAPPAAGAAAAPPPPEASCPSTLSRRAVTASRRETRSLIAPSSAMTNKKKKKKKKKNSLGIYKKIEIESYSVSGRQLRWFFTEESNTAIQPLLGQNNTTQRNITTSGDLHSDNHLQKMGAE
mmetsp:Transcript_38499/g.96883  ORF Transcript_38499/g.96883 Transcript_38499/m.96883 type:complete len:200 (-) Transcript_38499:1434-2033(-)